MKNYSKLLQLLGAIFPSRNLINSLSFYTKSDAELMFPVVGGVGPLLAIHYEELRQRLHELSNQQHRENSRDKFGPEIHPPPVIKGQALYVIHPDNTRQLAIHKPFGRYQDRWHNSPARPSSPRPGPPPPSPENGPSIIPSRTFTTSEFN